MKEILISAESRDSVGKGSARQTRQGGSVPGVMYGPETQPIPITVNERSLLHAMKSAAGTSALYTVELGGKSNKVIVREIQRDPVTSRILHIDFHAISMTKPLHLNIPIHFVGTPVGVKVDGGIMQTNMRELEILCLPNQIPNFHEVDVSELAIGESIHIKDISIDGVNILSDPNKTVVVISAPTVVKSAAGPEEAEAAAATAEGGAAEGETKEEKSE